MSDKKNKPKRPRRKSEGSSSSCSYSSSSLSSDEDANAEDLRPVKEYLADRKELARQLFKSVKGEKLRMMLPQALKRMELSELEEWCSSELSGMSKARILSILNAQPLVQSSDSDDTDDSGPSLEIISDTEEWDEDEDLANKEQELNPASKKSKLKKDKMKSKPKLHSQKTKEKDKGKSKTKGKLKQENEVRADEVKVKKEGEKVEAKEKEGESLLDLLELEMRARAIRALIRKEEDIIPTAPSAQNSTLNTNSPTNISKSRTDSSVTLRERNINLKAVEDKLEEMDKNFRVSVNSKNTVKQENSGDEEDVVLVVEPTPTIELLSSGSDGEEQGKRVNQRLENERGVQKMLMRSVVTNSAEGSKTVANRMDTRKENAMERLSRDKESGIDLAIDKAIRIANTQTDTAIQKATDDLPKLAIEVQVNIPIDNDSVTNKSEDTNLNEAVDTSSGDTTDKSTESSMFKKFKRRSKLKITDKSLNNSTDTMLADKNEHVSSESRDKAMEKVTNTPMEMATDRISDVEIKKTQLNADDKTTDKEIGRKDNEIDNDTSVETAMSDETNRVSVKAVNKSVNKGIENTENKEKTAEDTTLKAQNKITDDEDKSADLEIIIDLDDYPDDMDEMESSEKTKNFQEATTSTTQQTNAEQNRSTEIENKNKNVENSGQSETWASRYYQTEDVQCVIKESKIQSEIRKRLRERQRLARLNNSPNSNTSPIQTTTEAATDKVEVKTTGSVEEYLALKAAISVDSSNSKSLDKSTDLNTRSESDTATELKNTATEKDKDVDAVTNAN